MNDIVDPHADQDTEEENGAQGGTRKGSGRSLVDETLSRNREVVKKTTAIGRKIIEGKKLRSKDVGESSWGLSSRGGENRVVCAGSFLNV